MSLFKQNIAEPFKSGLNKPDSGIPIPLEKLSKYINYVEKGKIVSIGGRPSSGKTSLMDFIYFINVFKWWRELENVNKPPLKMIYFNMRSSQKIKMQKWLCLYMKLKYGMVVDIPTLNNNIGKLYELDEETKENIMDSSDFFDDLEEILTMVNGKQTPSSIISKIKDYMHTIGDINEAGQYELDEDHLGQNTLIYIDNVEYLLSETDGFQNMTGDGLKRKLVKEIDELREIYKINFFIIVPSKPSNSRLVRDSEPSYKDLNYFTDISDVGLVVYNPYTENNSKYLNYPVDELVIRGKNRFRTITVVKNNYGADNITVGAFFLGECGYFAEAPHPTNEEEFEEKKRILSQLP
jgi:hypothetical protein